MSERGGDRPDHKRLRLSPGLVLWGVVALGVLILLFQNSGDTNVQFFWLDVTAPLFLIIAVSLVLGWGLGELGSRVWSWRRNKGNQ